MSAAVERAEDLAYLTAAKDMAWPVVIDGEREGGRLQRCAAIKDLPTRAVVSADEEGAASESLPPARNRVARSSGT
jgi:hypothetical protein